MRLWLSAKDDGADAIRRQKELMHTAESGPPLKAKAMANTGAKGFAAIMKARAAKIREEFSSLADEINSEFDEQEELLGQGRAIKEEMRADAAELRDALGMKNDK